MENWYRKINRKKIEEIQDLREKKLKSLLINNIETNDELK